jgi:hypothetical protein
MFLGLPGSGSTIQRYGSGSGSFYHHAKIVLKNYFFAGILKVNDENSRIRNPDPDPPQNAMDPQHCCKPMYIVQQILYMDDVIQCPLCFLYTVYRSAEVREYKRVHKLVNREDETMSHKVLNKDNKGVKLHLFNI